MSPQYTRKFATFFSDAVAISHIGFPLCANDSQKHAASIDLHICASTQLEISQFSPFSAFSALVWRYLIMIFLETFSLRSDSSLASYLSLDTEKSPPFSESHTVVPPL